MVVPSTFISVQWIVLAFCIAAILFYILWAALWKSTKDAYGKVNVRPVHIKIWIAGILAAGAVAGISEQGFVTRPSDDPGVEIFYGRWVAHALICPAFLWIAAGIQALSERRAWRVAVAGIITSVAALFVSLSDADSTRWAWFAVGAAAYAGTMFLYLEKARGRVWARVYTVVFTAAYGIWLILHEILGIWSVSVAAIVYAVHDVLFTMLLYLVIMEFLFPASHVCCEKCNGNAVVRKQRVCVWKKQCQDMRLLPQTRAF